MNQRFLCSPSEARWAGALRDCRAERHLAGMPSTRSFIARTVNVNGKRDGGGRDDDDYQ